MKWFLFLILASLPTYQIRFKIFGLPTTLLEIMIIILFAVYFLRNYENITKVRKSLGDWQWLILAWLIVGLVAVFISPDKWAALGHWRAYFLEPILLLIVFLDLVKTKKDLNFVFYALGFSALYCALWAIAQKIWGGGMISLETWQYPLKPIWRATGPFPQANFLGLFLGPIVILAIGKLIENCKLKIENWRKLLVICYWLLVIIVSMLAIIFARSEGAILGILVGLIFLIFIYLKKRQKIIFLLILLVVSCWLLIASPWRNYLWERITFRDLSGQLRLNIWQATLNLLKDRPIFGAGLRGYQILISHYQKPFSLPGVEGVVSNELHPYPHNLFLAIWCELGILGLIIFLLILFQFFKLGFQKIIQTIRTYPNIPNKVFHFSFFIFHLSAMVSLLTHGAFDTPYFKNDLSILFWLIIGLLISLKKIDFSPKSEKI